MGWQAAIACLCFILATAVTTMVNVNSKWIPDIGWEVNCSWNLFSNDSLQSVRLYINDQQFLIYRPETDGDDRSLVFRRPEDLFMVHCSIANDERAAGTCVLTNELYQPPPESFIFACEVSGERPFFRMDKQSITIDAFVPPSDPVIEAGVANEKTQRTILNCSSSGLPGPKLVWEYGNQRVPADFTGSAWNATSKLWHNWAVVSYVPSNEVTAKCTPQTVFKGIPWTGDTAEYNSAIAIKGVKSMVVAVTITSLLLLR